MRLFEQWRKVAKRWPPLEPLMDLDKQSIELRDAWMGIAAWHVRELDEAVEAAAIEATRAAREPCGTATEVADGQIRMTVEGSTSEIQEFLASISVSPWTKSKPITIEPHSAVRIDLGIPGQEAPAETDKEESNESGS